MIIQKIKKICIGLMVVSTTVLADIPAAFVDIGFGARPMGMGGAFTGQSDDVHSIFWNPAGMVMMKNSQLTAMYTKQFGLIPYGLAAYATKYQNNFIGVGFITSGNDVLSETTFLASYAMVYKLPLVGKTGIGVNARYRHSSFGNNKDGGDLRSIGDANGFGLDFGFMWALSKRTRMGIFARDLINSVSYNNETIGSAGSYSESVPTALILGFSNKVTAHTTFALDYEKSLYSDTFDKIHIGGEAKLFNLIFTRGGMWQNLDTHINRNYSVGCGLDLNTRSFGVQFDFAYLFNDLAHTPRVSLSITH